MVATEKQQMSAAKERVKNARKVKKLAGIRLPKKKIPTPVRAPDRIATSYYRRIKKLMNPLYKIIRDDLIPQLSNLKKNRAEQVRLDNYNEYIDLILNAIRNTIFLTMSDQELMGLTVNVADQISDFNKGQVKRQFHAVLGIDVISSESWLDPVIDNFMSQNVSLIKSVPERFLADVQFTVRNGLEQGDTAGTIAENLKKRIKVSNSRAQLIARDQTNKFFGQLNRKRQETVGVDKYIWFTSKDERVRPNHASKEGKTFSWNKPPKDTGHPGQDINCRCVAIPVIDDLLD